MTPPWNFPAALAFPLETVRLPHIYRDEREMNGRFGGRSSRRQ